jgi:hypothetical protein
MVYQNAPSRAEQERNREIIRANREIIRVNREITGGERFGRFEQGAAPFRPNSAARNLAARSPDPSDRRGLLPAAAVALGRCVPGSDNFQVASIMPKARAESGESEDIEHTESIRISVFCTLYRLGGRSPVRTIPSDCHQALGRPSRKDATRRQDWPELKADWPEIARRPTARFATSIIYVARQNTRHFPRGPE